MRRTAFSLALALVFAMSVVFASSAVASRPAPPPGCQFTQGITSCTTTTTTSEQLAPLQFGQGTIGSTNDGPGAALLCAQQGASYHRLDTIFVAVLLTTTMTTVTSHHGAPNSNGRALPTETTTSTVASIYAGQVSCF
jgi:hypothetical protein